MKTGFGSQYHEEISPQSNSPLKIIRNELPTNCYYRVCSTILINTLLSRIMCWTESQCHQKRVKLGMC